MAVGTGLEYQPDVHLLNPQRLLARAGGREARDALEKSKYLNLLASVAWLRVVYGGDVRCDCTLSFWTLLRVQYRYTTVGRYASLFDISMGQCRGRTFPGLDHRLMGLWKASLTQGSP